MGKAFNSVLTHPSRLFYGPKEISLPKALSRWLLRLHQEDPEAFSEATVFCSHGSEIPWFYRACYEVGLYHPPKVISLEEPFGYAYSVHMADQGVPPAPPMVLKALMLQVLNQQGVGGKNMAPEGRLAQAEAFLYLWEQVTLYNGDWQKVKTIIPENLSQHFQETQRNLTILSTVWPAFLAAKGVTGNSASQWAHLKLLEQMWEKKPPSQWILALGSWQTSPPVRYLLGRISRLPRGCVLFPYIGSLDEKNFSSLAPTHPLYTVEETLKSFGCTWEEVAPFPEPKSPLPQKKETGESVLLHSFGETLRLPEVLFPEVNFMAKRVHFVPCSTQREEVLTVALLLRDALEDPDKTTLFVTEDLKLVHDVLAELTRWKVVLPQTLSMPFLQNPEATLAMLVLHMILEESSSENLLAVLRHPLVACPSALVREVEALLRGYHWPKQVWSFLQDAVSRSRYPLLLSKGISQVKRILDPLWRLKDGMHALKMWIQVHAGVMEALCPTFGGDSSELMEFWLNWSETSSAYPIMTLEEYRGWFGAFLKTGLPARWNSTPEEGARLHIVRPLEAPFFSADRCILGGLNEGSWPPFSSANPWLSHSMAKVLGLPPEERQVGIFALAFVHCCTLSEVFLTRSTHVDGSSTLPSRFWVRLESTLQSAGVSLQGLPSWVKYLVQEAGWKQGLVTPPPNIYGSPCPPLSARPSMASVTEVDLWRRNPYAFYVSKILKLRPPSPLQPKMDKRIFGILLHQSLEHFMRLCPPDQTISWEKLQVHLNTVTQWMIQDLPISFFQRRRIEGMMQEFATQEWARRSENSYKSFLEVRGSCFFPDIPFRLTARADRIDCFEDGHVEIIDYKTGAIPTVKEVTEGEGFQLPLEALILLHGGFSVLRFNEPKDPTQINLSWWQMSLTSPVRLRNYPVPVERWMTESFSNWAAWIRRFLEESQAYDDTGQGGDADLALLSRREEKSGAT